MIGESSVHQGTFFGVLLFREHFPSNLLTQKLPDSGTPLHVGALWLVSLCEHVWRHNPWLFGMRDYEKDAKTRDQLYEKAKRVLRSWLIISSTWLLPYHPSTVYLSILTHQTSRQSHTINPSSSSCVVLRIQTVLEEVLSSLSILPQTPYHQEYVVILPFIHLAVQLVAARHTQDSLQMTNVIWRDSLIYMLLSSKCVVNPRVSYLGWRWEVLVVIWREAQANVAYFANSPSKHPQHQTTLSNHSFKVHYLLKSEAMELLVVEFRSIRASQQDKTESWPKVSSASILWAKNYPRKHLAHHRHHRQSSKEPLWAV